MKTISARRTDAQMQVYFCRSKQAHGRTFVPLASMSSASLANRFSLSSRRVLEMTCPKKQTWGSELLTNKIRFPRPSVN